MSWEPGNWRARSNRIGRIVGRPIKCDLVGRSQWRSILRLGAHPIFYWKQLLAVDLAVYFSRFCADFISKCLIIETVYLSKFWLKVVIVFSQFFASKYALRTATDYFIAIYWPIVNFFYQSWDDWLTVEFSTISFDSIFRSLPIVLLSCIGYFSFRLHGWGLSVITFGFVAQMVAFRNVFCHGGHRVSYRHWLANRSVVVSHEPLLHYRQFSAVVPSFTDEVCRLLSLVSFGPQFLFAVFVWFCLAFRKKTRSVMAAGV